MKVQICNPNLSLIDLSNFSFGMRRNTQSTDALIIEDSKLCINNI